MVTKMTDKIIDRLSKKIAKTTPFRTDFVLADFRVLDDDKKTAEILIQYDKDFYDTPSKELIAQTMMELFKASDNRPRVIIDPNSVRYFPRYDALICTASVPVLRRPITDVKRYKMQTIVAGTSFLGENMEDVWNVGKSAEGHVFIERLEDDDIDTILRERAKGKAFRTHAHAKFNSLTLNRISASTSKPLYSINDKVKCAYNGKMRVGKIVGLTTGGAQICFARGEQATVAIEALHGLVQAAEKGMEMNLEAIKDYYRKAYGYSEEDLAKLVSFIE
jgi:hypothetical protein